MRQMRDGLVENGPTLGQLWVGETYKQPEYLSALQTSSNSVQSLWVVILYIPILFVDVRNFQWQSYA